VSGLISPSDVFLLDGTLAEERGAKASFIYVFAANGGKAIASESTGRFTLIQYSQAFDSLCEACSVIEKVIRDSILESTCVT
jgi:hypothetical protein